MEKKIEKTDTTLIRKARRIASIYQGKGGFAGVQNTALGAGFA
jgi:hypothetical protein